MEYCPILGLGFLMWLAAGCPVNVPVPTSNRLLVNLLVVGGIIGDNPSRILDQML